MGQYSSFYPPLGRWEVLINQKNWLRYGYLAYMSLLLGIFPAAYLFSLPFCRAGWRNSRQELIDIIDIDVFKPSFSLLIPSPPPSVSLIRISDHKSRLTYGYLRNVRPLPFKLQHSFLLHASLYLFYCTDLNN